MFKKSSKGNKIDTKRPDMTKVEWSEPQKAQRQRVKRVNEYANADLADPDVRAVYKERAAREGKSAFALARSDYFVWKRFALKEISL